MGKLLACTYTQLKPVKMDYDLFSAWRAQISMYLSPSQMYMIWLTSLARIYLYFWFVTWCLRINNEYHNALYVPQCGILSDYFIIMSMCIFSLRKNTRSYEVLTVLNLYVYLLVPLGYLAWYHLGIILDGLWDLSLACQLECFSKHLLGIHLKFKSTCFLNWHLAPPL